MKLSRMDGQMISELINIWRCSCCFYRLLLLCFRNQGALLVNSRNFYHLHVHVQDNCGIFCMIFCQIHGTPWNPQMHSWAFFDYLQ